MSKQVRILAIAPTARGFGYCVMEDGAILECGYKGAKKNKNVKSVAKIEKLMNQFLPSGMVLQDLDATGCRRAPRIKALHRQIIELAAKQNARLSFFQETSCVMHCSVMSKEQSKKWQNCSPKNIRLNLLRNCHRNVVLGRTKTAEWTCLMLWGWP